MLDPRDSRPEVPLDAEGLVPFRNLFEKNQTVFGGVNASLRSFALAVEDLGRFDPNVLAGMIRRTGFSDFRETILGPLRLFLSVS